MNVLKENMGFSQKELSILRNALDCNIINTGELSDNIEQMKTAEILNRHPYAITANKDGRFSSYLPDETKAHHRRKICKSSRETLEKAIVNFYKEREEKQSIGTNTLRQFYPVWFEYKSLHTTSSAYMRTIDELWRRYYINDPIIDRPMTEYDEYTLDVWAHKKIRSGALTKKQYYNMAIIMRQSLELARKKGIVSHNAFNDFKVDYKLFQPVPKKADSTQVFMTDEQPLIEQAAYQDFQDTQKTACLAIPFLFQTGLRASEVVALKWSDIDEEEENSIHIQRMEIKHSQRMPDGTWGLPERLVVPRTKSIQGDRNVYLTTIARSILEQIRLCNERKGYDNTGYIFLNENGRVTSPGLNKRIRRYCRRVGIPEKGLHKIRKTYISTLIDAGDININYIREQAGHADERTTYNSYCFNRKTRSLTAQSMENALVHK